MKYLKEKSSVKQIRFALAFLSLLVWSSANAVTFDFRNTNISDYSYANQGVVTVGDLTVTVEARTKFHFGTYNSSLRKYDGGLGVVNVQESGYGDSHTIDNFGGYDYLILQFKDSSGGAVNVSISDIENGYVGNFNGYFGGDADLSYGTSFDNMTTVGWANRHYGRFTDNAASDTWYIAAAVDNPDHLYDGFKLKTLTANAVVPIPAAAWLFGSALVGMAGLGYRRRKLDA
ncbi:VPLPA-CTERM sorting domain-containing protein [Imhoffiella purpurea]|uniref:VPLPA-CTERM sorting domain-containing protein n=1 Tax=Imhoffiella purpurea TaxID=1249627 RepID=UPI0012FE5CBF|nr:VPLPA-CTERM sorting domain-containing protein [Imhoffiella purpurea]